jgi:hypothetical protein
VGGGCVQKRLRAAPSYQGSRIVDISGGELFDDRVSFRIVSVPDDCSQDPDSPAPKGDAAVSTADECVEGPQPKFESKYTQFRQFKQHRRTAR